MPTDTPRPIIQRSDVVKFRQGVTLPDGVESDVLEGILYTASCGCEITFGVRLDTNGKAALHLPCPIHHNRTVPIIKRFVFGNEKPDEQVLADVLEGV